VPWSVAPGPGGLLAARVASDAYDRVSVIGRDRRRWRRAGVACRRRDPAVAVPPGRLGPGTSPRGCSARDRRRIRRGRRRRAASPAGLRWPAVRWPTAAAGVPVRGRKPRVSPPGRGSGRGRRRGRRPRSPRPRRPAARLWVSTS